MKNIDITEWLLNNGIEGECEIFNKKGEMVFLADLLEKHLKEQLRLHVVSQSFGLEKENTFGVIKTLEDDDFAVCAPCKYKGSGLSNAACKWCCENNGLHQYFG